MKGYNNSFSIVCVIKYRCNKSVLVVTYFTSNRFSINAKQPRQIRYISIQQQI